MSNAQISLNVYNSHNCRSRIAAVLKFQSFDAIVGVNYIEVQDFSESFSIITSYTNTLINSAEFITLAIANS